MAATDAIGIGERSDGQKPLAAGHLTANDPVERPAIDDFARAFWNHAGRVGLFIRPLQPVVERAIFLDPILEILDRVAADTELDEVKSHPVCEPCALFGGNGALRRTYSSALRTIRRAPSET